MIDLLFGIAMGAFMLFALFLLEFSRSFYFSFRNRISDKINPGTKPTISRGKNSE